MNAECLAPHALSDFYFNRDLDFECKVMLSSVESAPALSMLEYLRVFGWTCGLEALVYVPLLLLKKNSLRRTLFAVIFANLATHPLVTFVFPLFGVAVGWSVAASVIAKETFAPLVETLVLRRLTNLSWPEAIAVSVGANLFSWWAGAALAEQLF